MTVMDEVNAIVDRIMKSGMEMSDFIILGTTKMQEIQYEFLSKYRHYGSGAGIGGMQIYQYHTAIGMLTIKVNPDLPADHVSVGRITLNDFIIEDILLDDEDYNNIDNSN
jgi:hypothetical protein